MYIPEEDPTQRPGTQPVPQSPAQQPAPAGGSSAGFQPGTQGANASWDPSRPKDPSNKDDPFINLGRFDQGSALAGSRYGDARSMQMDAMQRYQDILAGKGTSLAQAQLQQQSQQNEAAALAAASMGRGGNTGAVAGQAMSGLAAGQQQLNQQSAMLRAQEEQAALAGLSGMSSQMAGQDLQAQLAFEQMMSGGMQAQLGADTEFRLKSRELAEMEKQGQFDRAMGVMNAAAGMGGSFMGGMMGSDRRLKENVESAGGGLRDYLKSDAFKQAESPMAALAGRAMQGIGSGTGGMVFMSDERVKEDVSKSDMSGMLGQTIPALRELEPVEYDYKEGMGPKGRQVGVMAQDLEKSALGRDMVTRRPGDGMRMVDTNKAAMLALAGAAAQQKEIDALKKRAG